MEDGRRTNAGNRRQETECGRQTMDDGRGREEGKGHQVISISGCGYQGIRGSGDQERTRAYEHKTQGYKGFPIDSRRTGFPMGGDLRY
jgi:hypothetical protein